MSEQQRLLTIKRHDWLLRMLATILQSDTSRTEMAKLPADVLVALVMSGKDHGIDVQRYKDRCGNDAIDLVAQILWAMVDEPTHGSMWEDRMQRGEARRAMIERMENSLVDSAIDDALLRAINAHNLPQSKSDPECPCLFCTAKRNREMSDNHRIIDQFRKQHDQHVIDYRAYRSLPK